MATRCTIKIDGPDRLITLYRHWDGYPAETGAHLAWIVRNTKPETAQALADTLLEITYEKQSYESAPRAVYETTRGEEHHGDTEWRYRIWIMPDGPGFQVLHRKIGTDWRPIVGGGSMAFRGFIATELKKLRARYHQMKRRSA